MGLEYSLIYFHFLFRSVKILSTFWELLGRQCFFCFVGVRWRGIVWKREGMTSSIVGVELGSGFFLWGGVEE